MKIALQGTTLLIKEADNVQFAVIKSWNKMRWDRKTQLLTGTADMELLDKLASIVQLPTAIAQRRSQLHRVQEAIDSERVNPHPKPLADYPVKMSLYDHQVRGSQYVPGRLWMGQPRRNRTEERKPCPITISTLATRWNSHQT